MALSTETQAWLDDLKKEGNISDEDYTRLKATFESNDKANNFVKGSVLRQADYSRQSATIQNAQKELETAQAEFKAKQEAVDKFNGELVTWKAGAETNFNRAVQEREKAERTAQAALARLKALATANGLDENEVLKDIEVAPVPEKKVESTMDTSGFLRKEDLQRGIAESALVDATIYDVTSEYQELTGKPLRNAAELVAEAIKANKPISQYVAEKFDFAKLRHDREEAAYKERLKQDTDAAVAARLSEMNLQGAIVPGRQDQSLRSPVLKPGGIPAPPAEGGGGVSAAVAAYAQGKYKQ